MKKGRLETAARLLEIIGVAAVTALLSARLHVAYYSRMPSGSGKATVLEIAPKTSFSEATRVLHEHGLLKRPREFLLLGRIRGDAERIQAGEYEFNGRETPKEILDILSSGEVRPRFITVPEGHSISQIAQEIEQAGLGSAESFETRARDPELAARFGIDAPDLEGYLFPDTYRFTKSAGFERIIETMVKRFRSVYRSVASEGPKPAELSQHEVVTLASIVEKETARPEERPLIAAVFLNRLRRGMRLESDPTVIYGIPDFDGNLTRKHLIDPTPYNTYKISGLPPGPIASPGKEALQAVLLPADVDYLYFVSKNDGSHKFSTRLSEHRRAVETYQLRRR